MASARPENGHGDVEPNITQQDPQQAYGGSPLHVNPSTQDPAMTQQTTQQIGPSYGLPAIAPTQSQSGQDPTGSTTLAVTNLPYRIRWQDLKDLFRRYGTPSRADVFLAPDGRSRGVGMVSMRTRREAENCVNDLNGYEWFGRKIGVKIDETGGHHALAAAAMAGATIWEGVGFNPTDYEAVSPQLQPYPASVNTNPYLSQSASPMLFVGNLPFSTQWQDLKDLLRPAGRILRADIALGPDGRSKGWGTAVFASPQEAQHAIDTFDGWEVEGRIIKVRWDKFQGVSGQPSPQMAPATLSSPQMMQAQLSPTQTPRPSEYVTVGTANSAQAAWQSQYMQGTLRSMPSLQGQALQPGMPLSTPQSQFMQSYVPQQFMPQAAPTSPGRAPAGHPGAYQNVLYGAPGGWYQTGYSTATLQPLQPAMTPQVRLPADPSVVSTSQSGQSYIGQQQRTEYHDPYGPPLL